MSGLTALAGGAEGTLSDIWASPSVIGSSLPIEYTSSWIWTSASVGNFEAVKAPGFNELQQTSTSGVQTFQQQSLRNNEFQPCPSPKLKAHSSQSTLEVRVG